MVLAALLPAVFLLASAFAAVAAIVFFGDPAAPTPLGRLARLFGQTVPAAVWRVAQLVGVAWVLGLGKRVVMWFLFKRHPIVLIAYLCLVIGAYGVFVVHGYPHLPNMYMAGYHKTIGAVLFALCLITFVLAAFTDPGVIRKVDVEAWKAHYPYDDALYPAPSKEHSRECTTCGMEKVPRSKHSRVTDRCVARFDHYCIWLATDVGARNYRWFMAFLVCNTSLMLYGAFACVSILADLVVKNRLLEATFVNSATGEKFKATYYVVFTYLMSLRSEIIMVLVLAGVMGVVLAGFTGYHVYLLAQNKTTNESYKWSEVQWHRDRAVQEAAALAKSTGKPLGHIAPMPPNVYNRGAWANAMEVFFPPSATSAPAAAGAKTAAAAAKTAPAAAGGEAAAGKATAASGGGNASVKHRRQGSAAASK